MRPLVRCTPSLSWHSPVSLQSETITLPSGAQLTIDANGAYIYNPNAAFAVLQVGQSVTDTFTYLVSDGQGGMTSATVTIIVNGENDRPTANVDVNSVVPRAATTVVAPLGLLSPTGQARLRVHHLDERLAGIRRTKRLRGVDEVGDERHGNRGQDAARHR